MIKSSFFNYLILIFSLFIIISCRKAEINRNDSDSVYITCNDKEKVDLDERYATFIDTMRLETNDNSLLRKIDRICADEDLSLIHI